MATNLTRFLDQRAPATGGGGGRGPACIAGGSASSISWKRRSRNPEILERLDGDARLAAGVLDMFEHSGYFADELLRYPELLEEIGEPFRLEGGALLATAARCAASTAARCCASRAKACWKRRPFSPRWARPRCWRTA